VPYSSYVASQEHTPLCSPLATHVPSHERGRFILWIVLQSVFLEARSVPSVRLLVRKGEGMEGVCALLFDHGQSRAHTPLLPSRAPRSVTREGTDHSSIVTASYLSQTHFSDSHYGLDSPLCAAACVWGRGDLGPACVPKAGRGVCFDLSRCSLRAHTPPPLRMADKSAPLPARPHGARPTEDTNVLSGRSGGGWSRPTFHQTRGDASFFGLYCNQFF
jgi:hypothetical protein